MERTMVSYLVTALMGLCLLVGTYLLGEWLVRRLAPGIRHRARRMRELDGADDASNDAEP
jgi:hypothetical protein